jgi:hypothetical protein
MTDYEPTHAEIYTEAAARLASCKRGGEHDTIAGAALVAAKAHANLDAADPAVSRIRAFAVAERDLFVAAAAEVRPAPRLVALDLEQHRDAILAHAREHDDRIVAARRRLLAALRAATEAGAAHDSSRRSARLPAALWGLAQGLTEFSTPADLVYEPDHTGSARSSVNTRNRLRADGVQQSKSELEAWAQAQLDEIAADLRARAAAEAQAERDRSDLSAYRAQLAADAARAVHRSPNVAGMP